MNKARKIILSIVFIIAIGVVIYLLTLPKVNDIANVDNNVDGDNIELNEEGIVNNDSIQKEIYSDDDRAIFENYINQNISTLSQEPEVLGGIFFVTSYNWIDGNTAFLAYEDGHNAYQGETRLSYDENSNVVVEYFYTLPLDENGKAISPVIEEGSIEGQEVNGATGSEILIEEPILLELE